MTGVYAYGFVDFKCTWKIFGTTSNTEIFRSTIDCASSWEELSGSDEGFNSFATDVLQRSLAQFLNTETVQKCLHDKNASSSVMEKWSTIEIPLSAKDTVHTLDEAVTAVTTVIVEGGHGSGCILSPDGYMVTNYHVIAEDTAKSVKILLSNGDSLKATYVRSNAVYDLALLKLNKPGPYKYFTVDTARKEIPLGDDIYAIGTPESIDLGQTITKGIISGTRPAGDKTIIQTDVSINPGNSGGALVSSTGHLVVL
jgi:S1-C subfamily serine protease